MTFHNYIFFSTNSIFQSLPDETRDEYKKEFLDALIREKDVVVNTYATLGLKVNTNILIWFQADRIDTIQEFLNKLMHSSLGRYLQITYTFFGISRPTQYSPHSTIHEDTNRKGLPYLIIYPFTKTKEWHMLD